MFKSDTRRPYADFQYYHDSYHGALIGAGDFLGAEKEAEAYVDAITFGRIRKLDEIPGCVKDAICSAAEVMHDFMEGRKSQVRSESNDGYSVTYAEASKISECQNNMGRNIRRHLANTGLTYKGWSRTYDEKR